LTFTKLYTQTVKPDLWKNKKSRCFWEYSIEEQMKRDMRELIVVLLIFNTLKKMR
jgi:hypothetical protein